MEKIISPYLQYATVIRRTHRQSRRSCARTFAKIGVVSRGINHPIAPTNISKRNIQAFAAALLEALTTVGGSLFPSVRYNFLPVQVCVDNNERPGRS